MTSMQIKCFLEAASKGSFTEAAQALFVTQPALSRQIAVLEQELGVTLFDRRNNRISLTAAGQELQLRLRPLVSEYQSAVEAVRMVATGINGRLSVGLPNDMVVDPMLQKMLTTLLRQNSGLDLQIAYCTQRELCDGLHEGRFDMISMVLPTGQIVENNNKSFLLSLQPICVAVCEGHQLATQTSVSVQELSELTRTQPLMMLSPTAVGELGGQESAAGILRNEPYTSFHKRYLSSMPALEYYLRAGAGIAFVTPHSTLTGKPGIRTIQIEAGDVLPVGVLWDGDNTNPALHQLIALLEQEE